MIILSKNSIITYKSQEPLDLMNAPPKDSANNLYADYFNFINNILAIYDTQNNNDTIPVFITRANNINNIENRIPDSNSTLQRLVPGNSYKIIVANDAALPLHIPNPLSLDQFGNIHNGSSCSPKIEVSSIYANNNIVLPSGILSTNLELSLNKLLPYETYSYHITPLFSNWPAKLASSSGTILYTGPETNGYVSGEINTIFSYFPNIANNLDTIPYTINADINKDYYNNNIFTVLNISISNKNCILYDNNYVIRCNECVNTHSCPSISLSAHNHPGNNLRSFIHGTVNNLKSNIDYSYKFETVNANWPAHITPLSGLLKAKDISSGTAFVHAVFTFLPTAQDPKANLSYSHDSYINNPDLLSVFSSELKFVLEPINSSYCSNISSSVNITYNTPDHSSSYVKFLTNLDRNFYNPTIPLPKLPTSPRNYRAGSEITAATKDSCCKSVPIDIGVYNLKQNEVYTYSIESYPRIDISPSSGIIADSMDNSTIRLSLNDIPLNTHSLLNVRVTHQQSQKSFDDNLLIRCLDGNSSIINLPTTWTTQTLDGIARNSSTLFSKILMHNNGDKLLIITEALLNNQLYYKDIATDMQWRLFYLGDSGQITDAFISDNNNDDIFIIGKTSPASPPSLHVSSNSLFSTTIKELPFGGATIAGSDDGTKLIVGSSGIATSSNSGNSWTLRDNAVLSPISIASSSDGNKLAAVSGRGGKIYISDNNGITWKSTEQDRQWLKIISSDDGNTLVAITSYDIVISYNRGDSWQNINKTLINIPSNGYLSDVAGSSDLTTLIVAVTNGQLYVSKDKGFSFHTQNFTGSWRSVACSKNGSKLAATDGSNVYTFNSLIG